MNPEEIRGREFLVGRGYLGEEVRAFLAEVAAEHEALQREIQELRSGGAPEPSALDEFESLGNSVAAVLRAAKESAAEITSVADQAALHAREEAEHYASSLRAQAEQILAGATEEAESLRHRVTQEAEEMRRAAAVALADARAESDRILREANERIGSISGEIEARRTEADAMFADAEDRLARAERHEETIRRRLREASEEIALALMALGDESSEGSAANRMTSSPFG